MEHSGNLRNIGPVSRQWLAAAGMRTRADVRKIGAVEAYGRVCDLGFKPSLNLLWALEGALRDIPFFALTAADKKVLRQELARRTNPARSQAASKNKSQNVK